MDQIEIRNEKAHQKYIWLCSLEYLSNYLLNIVLVNFDQRFLEWI